MRPFITGVKGMTARFLIAKPFKPSLQLQATWDAYYQSS